MTTYETAERPTPAQVRQMKAMRLREQGNQCAHCSTWIGMDCHLDHIIPFSRGGSNLYGNMQALCAPCNLSKGARMTRDDFGRGMVRNQAAALRPAYRAPALNEYPEGWSTGTIVTRLGIMPLAFLFVGRLATSWATGEWRDLLNAAFVVALVVIGARLIGRFAIRTERYGYLATPVQRWIEWQESGQVENGLIHIDGEWRILQFPGEFKYFTRGDKALFRAHLARQGAITAMHESEEYLAQQEAKKAPKEEPFVYNYKPVDVDAELAALKEELAAPGTYAKADLVIALLRKADRTDTPEEELAYREKAHALMEQYGIPRGRIFAGDNDW